MIKLLLVDDEKGLCEYLRDFFKLRSFTVFTATNGQDALSLVKKEKPKVVFLDIKMSGMSGLEVLKEIKKIDSATKVIMVTVLDDEKTKDEAKKLGADSFITKPFITDRLEEIVGEKIKELLEEKGQ
ncbi:MAG: response regulator [Candidatus Omnitrophica bacterium]|nr:response regulator [Candidatus Omnitrophota bacterium]